MKHVILPAPSSHSGRGQVREVDRREGGRSGADRGEREGEERGKPRGMNVGYFLQH